MKLNCVCLLDETSSKKIRKLMEVVSEKCGSKNALGFAPHLTLRGDFEVESGQLDALKAGLSTQLDQMDEIKITTTKYGYYPWKIVYLDVEKSNELVDLHTMVMEEIQKHRTKWVPESLLVNEGFRGRQKEYVDKYGYHFAFEFFSPHFTIAGNDMSKKAFEDIKREVVGKSERVETVIDKVVLMNRESRNELIFEKKLNLG